MILCECICHKDIYTNGVKAIVSCDCLSKHCLTIKKYIYSLQDRLTALERSHEKLYDCHDELEESFERFHEQSQQLDGLVNAHEEYLKKIELCNLTQAIDTQVWKHVSERIDNLEVEFNIIRSLGSRAYNPKKPHKCPVCYGQGSFILESLQEAINNNGCKLKSCHACEGKGIVWG